MFTVQKLAALVAITGTVLYGAKLIGRLDEVRRAVVRNRSRPEPGARKWVRGENLHQCSRCGVYVSRGADCRCDRQDGRST